MSKGANTRDLIISKSAELFNLYGYEGTSLRDIMQATTLKKGGIYNHFANKDEIALAALDYGFARVIRRFRDRLDHDTTAAQKLVSIIEVFASFVQNPVLEGGCPIFNTIADVNDLQPELKQRAIEGVNTLVNYVRIKIEEGIESGEFRKSADPNKTASLMVSSLEGALLLARVTGNEIHMQTTADYMKSYITEKLLAS